jgi:hypothetical protein
MSEPLRQYVKWNKQDTKGQTAFEFPYAQSKQIIDTEGRIEVSRNWVRGEWVQSFCLEYWKSFRNR